MKHFEFSLGAIIIAFSLFLHRLLVFDPLWPALTQVEWLNQSQTLMIGYLILINLRPANILKVFLLFLLLPVSHIDTFCMGVKTSWQRVLRG